MQDWTIKKLLDWITSHFTEKELDSPRLFAEMLLAHVLEKSRIELYTNFNKTVSPEKLAQLRDLVRRAAASEPVQYLTGRCEFYSLTVKVDRRCLIPRPETELLVERAIEYLRTAFKNSPHHPAVLDLCTGSGCIAVAIAKNFPTARVTATDISEDTLAVAAENVETHSLGDSVKLLQGSLYEPLVDNLDPKGFDLIVSNPPYISQSEYENLPQNIRSYEPSSALLAGPDGMDIYRQIASDIEHWLKSPGLLLLETDPLKAQPLAELLNSAADFAEISIEKDLAGCERIVRARR
jgi:release factor glutamine methyltransferase